MNEKPSIATAFSDAVQDISRMERELAEAATLISTAEKRINELNRDNLSLRQANDRFLADNKHLAERLNEMHWCLQIGTRIMIDVAKGNKKAFEQYAPKTPLEREAAAFAKPPINGHQPTTAEVEDGLREIVGKIKPTPLTPES